MAFKPGIKALRLFCKGIGFCVALMLAIVFIPLGWFSSLLGRFSEVSVFIAIIPFYIGEYTRSLYYRCLLQKVGNNVTFKYGSFCQYRNAG